MANFWSSLALLLRKIDICAQRGFCRKYNFGQLLIKTFFEIIGTVAAFSPKVNILSHFSALF